MRKSLLWIAPAILAVAFLCTAFGGGDDSKHSNGSPGGYTGSPGDGHNCNSCHGGSTATVTGWITSDIPADGYTPGTTYTITATATGSGRKGFEISPQSLSGSLLGTLTPGSGNKLCNGNKAITHSSGVNSNPATWTFSWTAPAAGTGSVTFYGAFAITESATKITTMVVSESATLPLTATATATPNVINIGQSSQLDVIVSGGTGTYSYSWVSNPAGFTSTLQNPVVSPTVSTIYTVTVTSGTSTVNSPVTVLVNPANPLTATATATPSTICAGQSSQLGVNVTGGNPPYTFSWTSDPPGFTSSIQGPSVSPAATTTYSVQVGDGTSFVASSVTVTVNQAPLAAAGNDTTYCKDVVEIPLHGTASNYASVAWTTSGDGTFSTSSSLNSIYYPGTADRSNGSVNLTLTASPNTPCTAATSVCHIILEVCDHTSGNYGETSSILLSPNPSDGLIYINFKGLKVNDPVVTVYDNLGKQVFTKNITVTTNPSVSIDLSSFPKGMYYVKVETNNYVKTQKVILQ